jgi:hypothetical protein
VGRWGSRGRFVDNLDSMDPVPVLKTCAAAALTLPLGVVVYRRQYWSKLTTDQQELLRGRRKQLRSSLLIAATTAIVLILMSTGRGMGTAPFWALLVAWAFSWPLAAASYAHWSLGLLKADPEGWLMSCC